ncbi:MAG TPA: DUF697 domain-containing protein, partial [Polyangiaceae bacterium]
ANQHIVVHVLNAASAISAEDEKLRRSLLGAKTRSVTVVNKIDLLDADEKRQCLESVYDKLGLRESEVLTVSAKRGTGIVELVQRIAELLPAALQDTFIAQQRADEALKEKRIRALIYSKAGVCAAVALAPIPIADILVLTPIQMAMVATIGYFHGVEVTPERATELMGVMGAGVGLRGAARQLVRLVPGYGMVVGAGIAFAGTVALGESANVWFKRRMKIDGHDLKELFAKVATRAKREYGDRGAITAPDAPAALEMRRAELRRELEKGAISQIEFNEASATLDHPSAEHDDSEPKN